jgi:hypothetical protein
MVKLRKSLPKWFSKDSIELVKTGTESTKAVFDLAKAIKENKGTLAELQPYLGHFIKLLRACPADIEDKLAREPIVYVGADSS